jgi:hypothetical protein
MFESFKSYDFFFIFKYKKINSRSRINFENDLKNFYFSFYMNNIIEIKKYIILNKLLLNDKDAKKIELIY